MRGAEDSNEALGGNLRTVMGRCEERTEDSNGVLWGGAEDSNGALTGKPEDSTGAVRGELRTVIGCCEEGSCGQ